MIDSIVNWFSGNWMQFSALSVAFIGLGVSIRRYELARSEKKSREEKAEKDAFQEFKKSVYSKFSQIESTLSSHRSDIEKNSSEIDKVDDYSIKVRARVLKLDDKVSECIAISNDAAGYLRGKSE